MGSACTTAEPVRNSRASLASPSPPSGDLPQLAEEDGITLYNQVGQGSFGRVYQGLELKSGRQLSVKVVNSNTAKAINLEKEANILRGLTHPNIVRCVKFRQSGDYAFMVMEHVSGGTLTELVEKLQAGMPELLAWKFTTQLVAAVVYIHSKHIVHRDIKGKNVMLTSTGSVKLLDFSCALVLESDSAETGSVSFLGTPFWMSPEVIKGEKHGKPADIWGIGATVYEMITGRPPFAELDAVRAMVAISEETIPLPSTASPLLVSFLRECFNKDQASRVSSQKLMEHPWLVRGPTQTGGSPLTPGKPTGSPTLATGGGQASNMLAGNSGAQRMKFRVPKASTRVVSSAAPQNA